MPQNVYERVRKGVLKVDPFFREGKYSVDNALLITDQKIVVALRQTSLGIPADGIL